MPFYIRKSVSVGPFRFNLSKSGIGVSAGIKGLRIGTGPRGHYIHAGRGGLYYRSSLGGSGKSGGGSTRGSQPAPPRGPERPPAQYAEPNVQMVRVSSEDVLRMQDARYSDVLADLKAKQAAIPLLAIAGWAGGVLTLLATMTAGASGLLIGCLLTSIATLLGWWADSSYRSSVLMYDLEDEAREAYEEVVRCFDLLTSCAGRWHIDAGGAIQDIHAWKRNAGAGHVLDRRSTEFSYSLPRVIKSNVTPPAIKCGKETLYFLPDFLLVIDSAKIGAVAYDGLSIKWQGSHFIEDGAVPSDTQVLYHTWKHPNKNGGPDRRFSNNYQVPVCQYENIYLTSQNGLNELLLVSRNGVTQPFSSAIGRLAAANGSGGVGQSLPPIS